MATKFNTSKLALALFLTLCVLIVPAHCYTKSEPEEELFDCLVTCDRKQLLRHNERELSECEQKCVRDYQEKKRKEREEQKQERIRGGTIENHHHHDPVQEYKQCQSRCGKQQYGEQRQLCQQKCLWEYEKEKEKREREGDDNMTNAITKSREEKEETGNPYFFESRRFSSRYKTEDGHIKVLERFSKRSELLQGVENYRLAILEANPNTFVVPHHCDAESVFVVVGGKGTLSCVWKDQRQSFNLKHGDVMRVPAGSIVYLINHDDNERLYVLKMLQPINTPGRFKEYFGVGGENPESFYRAFRIDILEAAFNAPRASIEKLLRKQGKGVIIKASKEQIRSLSKESKSSWGREGESWVPFNLLSQQPLFSNQFGKYFEANPNNFEKLKDLDVSVAFINIKKGGMMAPYYNSKSSKLMFVVGGSGQYEMACPHLSEQSQGSQETSSGVHYQRVSARLSIGDAFVIPAGHPITIVASPDSDLQIAAFGIMALDNQKYFLAGKENVWNQVESAAKELSFKSPAREVEEVFGKQEYSFFLPAPGHSDVRRGHNVASILDFAGF